MVFAALPSGRQADVRESSRPGQMPDERVGRRPAPIACQPVESFFQLVLWRLAEHSSHDAPFLIEECSCGKRWTQLEVIEVHAAGAHPYGKADVEFGDELGDLRPRLTVIE